MAQVITIAGERLFALKAQNNERLDIDTFIFANVPGQDPNAPINRSEGVPPVGQQVHTQIVQQVGRVNDNVVIYSTVMDSLTGPFEFNWVGLYSSVNQTLIAISHIPTVQKTVTVPGAAGNTLNRNFGIEYSGIADLTGITVAPETWQLDYTARLNGMDELTRQLAADMNGKDWFIGDGFKVVPRSTLNSFKVTPGAGYVSGLRVELAAEHILTLSTYPQFVYVDAWFDGTTGSTWKGQTAFTVTNTEMDDYVDITGKQHYVFKLATITAADQLSDLRDVGALDQIKKDLSKGNLDIKFASGTAASPSLVFADDQDTGLFKKANGNIGISTGGVERLNVNPSGRVAIGTDIHDAKLFVVVDNDISVAGRFKATWIGTEALQYQNNDTMYVETYNDIQSNSTNFSWGLSCSNTFNKIPAGVTDSGSRVGVYGWTPSINQAGFTHAGTLNQMFGIWGKAGYQGTGALASPVGAQINLAVGVKGEVASQSPGAKILQARAGDFTSYGYETGDVTDNFAIYAEAGNGSKSNWSFFGAAGEMYNRDIIKCGSNYTDAERCALVARGVGNSISWGFPDAGYGCNMGATPSAGNPFIAFSAEVDPTADTFRTRGIPGLVYRGNLAGGMDFGRVPNPNAAGQNIEIDARHQANGVFSFLNPISVASAPPETAISEGQEGQITWDGNYVYVCIATNTWKRVALTSW